MPTQLALSFDAGPITCEVQQRYHSIAPCLAGVSTPVEQAQALNLGYSTITRWLREFPEKGLPGLFSDSQYPREPYTPERVIVQLLYFKCCAPKAPLQHAHPFQTKQMALFDPLWLRDPLEPVDQKIQRAQKKTSAASQLRLYFGPEFVKSA